MKLEALKSGQKKTFNRIGVFDNFYLAGGTALALQLGHRVSAYFDLFYKGDLPANWYGKIKRVFKNDKIEFLKEEIGRDKMKNFFEKEVERYKIGKN